MSRLFTPEVAAAAFRLKALADGLATLGHEVTVLTTTPPRTAGAEEGFSAYTVDRWPVLRNDAGNVRGYVQYASYDLPLVGRLLLRSADVVISEPPPTTGVVTALVCFLKRVPFYYYAADIWSDAVAATTAPKIVTKIMRTLERFVLHRASGIIAVSEGVAERVRNFGAARNRIKVVANGVDTETFHPITEVAEVEDPYFVYTGTMSEWQGPEVFVRALALVLRTQPKVRLKFFGQGAAESHLRTLASELAPNNVEFGGVVPPTEAARWISGATGALVSIVPDLGYDFAKPTKIYAAAACGTPVLFAGADSSSGAKLVQDNALGAVAEYTPESVAEQMLSLLDGHHRDEANMIEFTRTNASLATTGRAAAQWVTDDMREHIRYQ